MECVRRDTCLRVVVQAAAAAAANGGSAGGPSASEMLIFCFLYKHTHTQTHVQYILRSNVMRFSMNSILKS